MRTADFPGGPAVESPSVSVRDTGSIPDLGTKIHMPWGKWACALQQEKPMQWEAHAPKLE